MDILQWVIAATGLAGHYYIARQNSLGYWFWILGNGVMIFQTIDKQLYVIAGLFGIYTIISLYAISKWEENTNSGNACRCSN